MTVIKVSIMSGSYVLGGWALMGLLLLPACNGVVTRPLGLVQGARTEIAALKENSTRVDQSVVVQGRVIRKIPLLSIFAYEVQDQTGRILVLTAESDWDIGADVTMQGQLRLKQRMVGVRVLEEFYIDALLKS
jgi:uncharacterized protein YdeI (BOF family)